MVPIWSHFTQFGFTVCWIYLAPICPLDPRPFSKHHRIQPFEFHGVYDTSCEMIATIIQMAIAEGSMIPIDQQTKQLSERTKWCCAIHESLKSTWPHQKWIMEDFTKKPTSILPIHIHIMCLLLSLNTNMYLYTISYENIQLSYSTFLSILAHRTQLYIPYFTMFERILKARKFGWIHGMPPSDHMQQCPPCTVDNLSMNSGCLGIKSFQNLTKIPTFCGRKPTRNKKKSDAISDMPNCWFKTSSFCTKKTSSESRSAPLELDGIVGWKTAPEGGSKGRGMPVERSLMPW